MASRIREIGWSPRKLADRFVLGKKIDMLAAIFHIAQIGEASQMFFRFTRSI